MDEPYLNGAYLLGKIASLVMRVYYMIVLTHESKFMGALTLDTLHYRNMYNLDLFILRRYIADLTVTLIQILMFMSSLMKCHRQQAEKTLKQK